MLAIVTLLIVHRQLSVSCHPKSRSPHE